ncbi:MAG: CPBP family intramembrane metalloprotease [Anaeromicrobium sp.]|jgi:membrane protease YdiL (CAAX protease family)|uniref:type II CAAX endopeptidase family protein n=1 Tax=Anaeromicrobium sp. TaxID=1929132 RepID=UPI0025CE816D|nr:type II CAAX endopeptidase family protein [Anaeromicrobium sp.]MCT4594123.1 CPBP family intramembrane metalloprotease [Anaeromicrobium sp.]
MENLKRPSIFGVNVLYLIVGIVLLTFGGYFQSENIKSGLVITEYLIILTPPILFSLIFDLKLKETFRLRKISIKNIVLSIGCTILIYPIAMFFNLIVLNIISIFSEVKKPPIPVANNMGEYIILMMIIAFSAGLCEEMFFRGLVFKAYEKMGKRKAIIISASLFGLFHFNIQNLLGPLVLGLLFAYLVEYTGSIWAGVIGHFTNNGLSVTMAYMANMAKKGVPISENPPDILNNNILLLVGTIQIGVIGLICGIILYKIIKSLKRHSLEEYEGKYNMTLKDYIPLLISLVIFIYLAYRQLIF